MDISRTKIAIATATVALLAGGGWMIRNHNSATLSADGLAEFRSAPRTPDLSSEVTAKIAAMPAANAERPEIQLPPPPPSKGFAAPAGLPSAAAALQQPSVIPESAQSAEAVQALQADPVIAHLSRYGTPITKQVMPVGGLTMWTVISKSGKTVKLYTTADGKALVSGVVWNLESGSNISEQIAMPRATPGSKDNFAAYLPQVVAPTAPQSNLVSGKHVLPAAFDGKAPTQIPEAIKLVDGLAGFTEGKGGPADTLYVIIDPRCPYCRQAYLRTREHVANGKTIKWIPTTALGRPEQGMPLAATVLHSKDPAVLDRVLGKHEQIATAPTPADVKQLGNNLDFMFEAFKQNNEPNPGVPVAFFIDRRSGKPRMMMGVSEQVVIDDILGNPNK